MKKKALFIDRDGTIIAEPPVDYQVDSLDKLQFVPGVIGALSRMRGLDYEFVMATNQDGLGTDSFPESDFWPAHNRMLSTLEGEGVVFDEILIDRSLESDHLPTRKPGTGMFGRYMGGGYDLASSYVIGDRITDVMLARNLGARAILLRSHDEGMQMIAAEGLGDICVLITDNWDDIWRFLRCEERCAQVERTTRETSIRLRLDLDGGPGSQIVSGLGFLDHMLWQVVHHGGIMLDLECSGDLEVDEHHTVEDIAIVLGEAVWTALGSKRGIERYGFALPMDDAEAMALLDFGGRMDFRWDATFHRERVGDMPTELFAHFFKSFVQGARCNLHITASGDNEHHKIEGIFKAFARALRMAIRRDPLGYDLPSSKGLL